jgi:hypothetical protein
MGHIAHLSHLGQYWKIFSVYDYAFCFFCDHYTLFHVMRKGGHCLETPQAYTYDLGVGIWTVIEIIMHFLFKRRRPWEHFVSSWRTYYQMLLETRNKNIYGLGVGSQWFSSYLGNSCINET